MKYYKISIRDSYTGSEERFDLLTTEETKDKFIEFISNFAHVISTNNSDDEFPHYCSDAWTE